MIKREIQICITWGTCYKKNEKIHKKNLKIPLSLHHKSIFCMQKSYISVPTWGLTGSCSSPGISGTRLVLSVTLSSSRSWESLPVNCQMEEEGMWKIVWEVDGQTVGIYHFSILLARIQSHSLPNSKSSQEMTIQDKREIQFGETVFLPHDPNMPWISSEFKNCSHVIEVRFVFSVVVVVFSLNWIFFLSGNG